MSIVKTEVEFRMAVDIFSQSSCMHALHGQRLRSYGREPCQKGQKGQKARNPFCMARRIRKRAAIRQAITARTAETSVAVHPAGETAKVRTSWPARPQTWQPRRFTGSSEPLGDAYVDLVGDRRRVKP